MIEIFFDGGFRAPSEISYGAFAFREGNPQALWKVLGRRHIAPEASCNVAEYHGVIRALEWVLKLGQFNDVRISGDSKLVIKQMQGAWKLKAGLYKPYATLALRLLSFSKCTVEFRWVPRGQNTMADALTREALRLPIDYEQTFELTAGLEKQWG